MLVTFDLECVITQESVLQDGMTHSDKSDCCDLGDLSRELFRSRIDSLSEKRQAAAVFRIARKIETISAKIGIAYKLCAPRQ